MANVFIKIKTAFDDTGLKAANSKIGKALGGSIKAGGAVAAGALGAVGAASLAATAAAVNFADESNAAMEDFRQQTGISEEGTKAFSQSMKSLFAAGAGENIADISSAMAEVANITQAGTAEVEDMTKKALILRDSFDKDVGESIDAVNVLTKEMGLSNDEAFDFIVSGIQGGLDANGDFLDTIREYGNLFGNAGFDAQQFYSILETGAEGGVLGTDKIADAYKELFINLDDPSAKVSGIMDSMFEGGFKNMQQFVKEGKATWGNYSGRILENLAQIEDPLERQKAQVILFGTAAEDLGNDFTESLSDASTSLQDMAGSMQNVEDRNFNMSEGFANLGRQLMVALEPAAQELMPLFADGLRVAGDFLMDAAPVFKDFAGNLSVTLGPALQIVGESLLRIGEVLGFTSEGTEGLDGSLQLLSGTLDLIVTGLEAVAVTADLVADAFEIGAGLIDQVGTISDLAGQALGGEAGGGLFGKDGALNILGFQTGGIVPRTGPAIVHQNEVIANPSMGQAIVIEGEEIAVFEAHKVATLIKQREKRVFQQYTNILAGALS